MANQVMPNPKVTVTRLTDGWEFQVGSVIKAGIPDLLRGTAPLPPDDGEWTVTAVYGNQSSAFGVRSDLQGLKRSFNLAKGGVHVGYIELSIPFSSTSGNKATQRSASPDSYGKITSSTTVTLDLPLQDLLPLLWEAEGIVSNSNLAHLFIRPFSLVRTWRMGAATLEFNPN